MHLERILCLVPNIRFLFFTSTYLLIWDLVPYIVGVNPNSPSNPHSAMASGGFDVDNIDTDPAQEAHILYGAVVGGPDKKGRYFDIRSDWPETEVKSLLPRLSATLQTDDTGRT
jgi:hypothetical protein